MRHGYDVKYFALKEKCPTLTVTFFLETTKTIEVKSGKRKLSAQGLPLNFFHFFNGTYKTGRD